jgi:BolA protein
MTLRDRIMTKLSGAFAPLNLDVIDESDRHVGHAGHRPGGETHFRIHIVAESFRGKSRIERHRLIYDTLVDEIADGVHALAIDATSPSERIA